MASLRVGPDGGLILYGVVVSIALARHAWLLLLLGPVSFVGCYCGICVGCERAGLL